MRLLTTFPSIRKILKLFSLWRAKQLAFVVGIILSPCAYGAWDYTEKIDPFEDTDRSLISPSAVAYENYGAGLAMAVGCQYDGLNVWIGHSYLIGDSDDEVRVQIRVDSNGPYSGYWALQGNEVSYMPKKDVAKIVAQMKAGNRLIIRVTDPLDGDTINQAISLVGFSKSLDQLSCK